MKIFKLIFSLLIIGIFLIIIDMVYILKFDRPLISKKDEAYLTCDVYMGPFYNVITSGNKYKVLMKWEDIECPQEFEVINETVSCEDSLEEIYRTNDKIYYLPCLESDNIKIRFASGKEYKLKEVLEKNMLTIEDVINQGLEVIEEEIEVKDNMNLIIDDVTYNVSLEDNETTKELLKMLPLNIEMQDLNANEKYYYLDKSLPTDSRVPTRINKGDLYLYGDDCLVLFYKDFNTIYKYTKIGHIDNLKDLDESNIKVEIK